MLGNFALSLSGARFSPLDSPAAALVTFAAPAKSGQNGKRGKSNENTFPPGAEEEESPKRRRTDSADDALSTTRNISASHILNRLRLRVTEGVLNYDIRHA